MRQSVSTLSEEVVAFFDDAAVLVPGQFGEVMTQGTLYEVWQPNYIHAPFEFIQPSENELRRPRIRIGLPVAATDGFEASLKEETRLGASVAAWHDGVEGPNALRVGRLVPGPLWRVYFDRLWPIEVGGQGLSFGWHEGEWRMRWYEGEAAVSVVRIKASSRGAPTAVTSREAGVDAVDYAFDPVLSPGDYCFSWRALRAGVKSGFNLERPHRRWTQANKGVMIMLSTIECERVF